VQGSLPKLVPHPEELGHHRLVAGCLGHGERNDAGDHVVVPSAGGAVQGRVALVVARHQEAAFAVVDHLGAVEEVVTVAAGCNDVEQGVPLVAGHPIKEMQQ